jgi:hypothetical protein
MGMKSFYGFLSVFMVVMSAVAATGFHDLPWATLFALWAIVFHLWYTAAAK